MNPPTKPETSNYLPFIALPLRTIVVAAPAKKVFIPSSLTLAYTNKYFTCSIIHSYKIIIPPNIAKLFDVPIILLKSFRRICLVALFYLLTSKSLISMALIKAAITNPIPPPATYDIMALGIQFLSNGDVCSILI